LVPPAAEVPCVFCVDMAALVRLRAGLLPPRVNTGIPSIPPISLVWMFRDRETAFPVLLPDGGAACCRGCRAAASDGVADGVVAAAAVAMPLLPRRSAPEAFWVAAAARECPLSGPLADGATCGGAGTPAMP